MRVLAKNCSRERARVEYASAFECCSSKRFRVIHGQRSERNWPRARRLGARSGFDFTVNSPSILPPEGGFLLGEVLSIRAAGRPPPSFTIGGIAQGQIVQREMNEINAKKKAAFGMRGVWQKLPVMRGIAVYRPALTAIEKSVDPRRRPFGSAGVDWCNNALTPSSWWSARNLKGAVGMTSVRNSSVPARRRIFAQICRFVGSEHARRR